MEVILATAYCFIFYYIINRSKFFKTDSIPHWFPGIFFLLKCIAGVLLGIVYTKFYTNQNDIDTFKFFTDSQIMFDTIYSVPLDFVRMFTGIDGDAPELYPYYIKMNSWLNTNPFFNDNRTIVRMNAFFRFFSMGYYNVHVIFINFISFAGIFCLYKTFISYCPEKKKELFILTFMLPSVLFWGSGLLKDGILLSGFGLAIYSFSLILRNGFTLKRLTGLFIGIFILLVTKIYVFILILPGLFAWWLMKKTKGIKVVISFFVIYALYFLTAFSAYRINPDYNAAALIFYKQKNFIDIGTIHNASMISLPVFECSGSSILKSTPLAFINTMFRPFLTDVHGNPMILLSALENLLIIFLILASLLSGNLRGKRIDPFIIFNIFFIVLLFALIGLITPVLGAIVRYRIVALPGLMFLLVYYYDRKKLLSRLSFFIPKRKDIDA